MNFSELSKEELEARKTEIDNTIDGITEKEALETMKSEVTEINARLAEIKDAEERSALAGQLDNGEAEGKVVETVEEIVKETRTMFGVETKEYRDAFYAMLAGKATEEQRSVLASPISVDGDGTNDGMAIAIPTTLDEKIWDNIHRAHPILEDITTVNSGIILQVTKHTSITAGKAKSKRDGASNSTASVEAEQNVFAKVSLVGKDYTKYVELTYAEAKMSQGALEDYLAQEIAADIGEILAKDVFAQIISDGASNSTSKSTNGWFETIATGLGTVTGAVKPVIYCTAANYYAIFGEVDTAGQPIFRDGVAIGAEVKIDSSVPSRTLAVVVDPTKFVLNVIQEVMIESDRDVREHKVVISGYCRAQGCMRDDSAAGKIVS